MGRSVTSRDMLVIFAAVLGSMPFSDLLLRSFLDASNSIISSCVRAIPGEASTC